MHVGRSPSCIPLVILKETPLLQCSGGSCAVFTRLPNLKLGIKPCLQSSKNTVLYFSRKRRSGSNDGPDQMEDLENKVRLFIDRLQ